MSKVISKIRCYNPSYKSTPNGNRNHLYYIAKRKMAMANEFGNTTFGEIEGLDLERAKLKDIAAEITRKSNQKTNIYRGIISLKQEDALKLGFDNKSEWEDLMHRNIYDIAKELGVPPLNTEWVAVVHLKKGNPHIHYMLWDKKQEVNSYFITPKTQNRIREMITKDIFSDELEKYYEIQNDLRKELRSEKVKLQLKAFSSKANIGKLAYINLSSKDSKELYSELQEIRKVIPKTGRLNYGLMPQNVKSLINNFIDKVIDKNVDFKNEYNTYLKISREIGKVYSDKKADYYENKAKEDLKKILGNQLLKAIKEINYEENEEKYLVRSVIQSLFRIFSQENERNMANLKLITGRGELSKESKIEYAIKKRNASSIEWDDEMW